MQPGESNPPSFPSFVISDDVRTTYAMVGGTGGSSGGSYRGEIVYVPGFPSSATRLTIVGVDGSLSFDLGMSASHHGVVQPNTE